MNEFVTQADKVHHGALISSVDNKLLSTEEMMKYFLKAKQTKNKIDFTKGIEQERKKKQTNKQGNEGANKGLKRKKQMERASLWIRINKCDQIEYLT